MAQAASNTHDDTMTNRKMQGLPGTTCHEVHEYICAIQSLTARVRSLSSETLGNPQRVLNDQALQELVLELISVSLNVKNIVYFASHYLESDRADTETVCKLRDAVTGSIGEIKSHVHQIKAYIETRRCMGDPERIRYN